MEEEGIEVNAGVILRGVDFDDEEYGFVEEGKDPRKVGSFLGGGGIAESGAGGCLLTNAMAGTK